MIANLCTTCGKDFTRLGNFDRHRTGQHGVDRRCMTTDEMVADGMRLLENGKWAGEAMPDGVFGNKEFDK